MAVVHHQISLGALARAPKSKLNTSMVIVYVHLIGSVGPLDKKNKKFSTLACLLSKHLGVIWSTRSLFKTRLPSSSFALRGGVTRALKTAALFSDITCSHGDAPLIIPADTSLGKKPKRHQNTDQLSDRSLPSQMQGKR